MQRPSYSLLGTAHLHPQHAPQPVLDLFPAEAGVAVVVEQALLCGERVDGSADEVSLDDYTGEPNTQASLRGKHLPCGIWQQQQQQ